MWGALLGPFRFSKRQDFASELLLWKKVWSVKYKVWNFCTSPA
jgi:hypothetical protein